MGEWWSREDGTRVILIQGETLYMYGIVGRNRGKEDWLLAAGARHGNRSIFLIYTFSATKSNNDSSLK